MGKTFVCSLCRNGIIGGGLYIDEQSITYSTQKLTVSPLYRDRKSTRLNSSHANESRMPSSA